MKSKLFLVIVIDLIVTLISFCLSIFLRFDFALQASAVYLEVLASHMVFLCVIQILLSHIFGIYKSIWRYVSINEALNVSLYAFFYALISFVYLNSYLQSGMPRSIYIMLWILMIALSLGIRVAYRYLRLASKSKNKDKKALIIGAGDAGNLLIKEIYLNTNYQEKVVGFLDDDKVKYHKTIHGIKVLGSVDDVESFIQAYDVDNVYIAMPSASNQRIKQIVNLVDGLATVKVMAIAQLDGQEKAQLRDVSINDLLGRGEIKLDTDKIDDYIKGKRVMVTGAGGSIGSELCRQIARFKPQEIICFEIYENSVYDLQQELLQNQKLGLLDKNIKLSCLIGSVRDVKRVDRVIKRYQPQVVFHAAAHKHVPLMETSPKEAIKNNIFGTYNVLNLCIKNQVERFVLISTDKAVNPTNVMGATKRMCELIVQSHKNNGITKIAAVRFGNVLGSNGSVIPLFKKQIAAGGPLTVTHKDITRYFMTIPEAVQLVLEAGAYANQGEIFVLDMGQPVKIVDLAEDLIRLSGLKPYEDIEIEFTGLRPGEKMYEELSLGYEKRYKTENDLIFVNEPMEIDLNDIHSRLNKLDELIKISKSTEIHQEILDIIQ